MNSKFTTILSNNFYICFFSIIIFINFFTNNKLYFNVDEINSINYYSNFYTLLIANLPNNHIITNFIGALGTLIFGYNVYYFKLINFFFCILFFFIFHNFYKNLNFLLIFFFLFFISNNLYAYSYLYRGYYFSSLIFSVIFVIIYENQIFFKKKNFNIVFFLLALLSIHSVYVFFLVVPILFANLYLAVKKLSNKAILNNFFYFYLVPFLSLEILKWFFTGLFLLRFSINFSDYNSILIYLFSKTQETNFFLINYFDNKFFNLIINTFSICYNGILTMYFNEYIHGKNLASQNENFIISLKFFFNDPVTFVIYFCSVLFAIKNLIEKFSIFDFIILSFFFLLIVSNKTPPERVYIGYIGFFIFYFFFNLRFLNIMNLKSKLFHLLSFTFIFYLSLNKNLITKTQVWGFTFEKNNQFCEIDVKYLNTDTKTNDHATEKNLLVFDYFTKCPYSSFKDYITKKKTFYF